jgi:hypothetical protein
MSDASWNSRPVCVWNGALWSHHETNYSMFGAKIATQHGSSARSHASQKAMLRMCGPVHIWSSRALTERAACCLSRFDFAQISPASTTSASRPPRPW